MGLVKKKGIDRSGVLKKMDLGNLDLGQNSWPVVGLVRPVERGLCCYFFEWALRSFRFLGLDNWT